MKWFQTSSHKKMPLLPTTTNLHTIATAGRQHLLSVKSWYSAFTHTLARIEVTTDGITLRPQKGNLEIEGLMIWDKAVDVLPFSSVKRELPTAKGSHS
jgi:hypothetical protein